MSRLLRGSCSISWALVAALGLVAHVAAQDPARSGFWLEGGWGAGTVRSACSGCPVATTAYGTSAHLLVGGALSRRALLGLEVSGLRASDLVLADGVAPVDAENGSIGPVVIWYPGGNGFFLKGGVGLARGAYSVPSASGSPVAAESLGSAITFGIGFDVGIARRFALTANLGMNVAAISDFHMGDTIVDDLITTVYDAAVGVTVR